MTEPAMMHNIIFDELTIGQTASIRRTLTVRDIELFAIVSGDLNPAHINEEYAEKSFFRGVIAPGMWTGGLLSMMFGTIMPGPGTIYLEQNMRFKNPVRPGDVITVQVTVKSKRDDKHIVTFDCLCHNQKGETVVEGTATVIAPTEKITLPRPNLPEVEIVEQDHYHAIINGAKERGRIKVAVVHPVGVNVIQAVAEAVDMGFIDPILIGPAARIEQAAKECEIDISAWPLINTEHSHAAAAKAVEMAAHGAVDALMKGSLHTDELLQAVVSATSGLRTERRISHAYIIDTPHYHKPLIISDGAINIAATLDEKADICQNAIALWQSLFGTDRKPKVALLSAVETVTCRIPSSIDAACLCKMAERGQITGGILDGPLAFDNAISKQAARDKGIVSPVAGDADILIVPNIETGNALAKQFTFLGHANAAGIVLGARVPIILTSRADSLRTRLLSCVVALYLTEARRAGQIK